MGSVAQTSIAVTQTLASSYRHTHNTHI